MASVNNKKNVHIYSVMSRDMSYFVQTPSKDKHMYSTDEKI